MSIGCSATVTKARQTILPALRCSAATGKVSFGCRVEAEDGWKPPNGALDDQHRTFFRIADSLTTHEITPYLWRILVTLFNVSRLSSAIGQEPPPNDWHPQTAACGPAQRLTFPLI